LLTARPRRSITFEAFLVNCFTIKIRALCATLAVFSAAFFLCVDFVRAAERIGRSLSEIVASAKREGTVRFCSSDPDEKDAAKFFQGFTAKYPGITVSFARCRGTESRERILTELIAGEAEYDLLHISEELISRYKKVEVLAGPFDWGRLFGIRPVYISPDRYFVAAGSSLYVIAYNTDLVPKERVPRTWEDCLDPYWRGKFVVDARPSSFSSLYPAWGKEKLLNYARQLGENKPIFKRGQTETLAQIAAGEYPMLCGAYMSSVLRLMHRDPSAKISLAVPKELGGDSFATLAVAKKAKSPNAALLLAGWLASDDGQLMAYEKVIFRGSPFDERGETGRRIKEAKAKVHYTGWEFSPEQLAEINRSIVQAWGLPGGKAR
jgi:iron(III) transport system substrate-binding protein